MEKSLKRKLNMKNDNWIFFVSKRFARVDRKGRSKVTSILASLGIGFLIVVANRGVSYAHQTFG